MDIPLGIDINQKCKDFTVKILDSASNTMEDWEKYRKARNVCVDKVRNANHAYYVKLADHLITYQIKNGGKYFLKVTGLKN